MRTGIRVILYLCISVLSSSLFGQVASKIEPPNWWAGMTYKSLQLMVYGPEMARNEVDISYPGITIQRVVKGQSGNYLFIYLSLSEELKPGQMPITFRSPGGETVRHLYEIKSRERRPEEFVGFNTSDVLYLITPDRFANGSESNDQVTGLVEGLARNKPYGRHGGDLKGIAAHLDYIDDMGFTAIWLNPVLENNMKEWSYHGYATTDYYSVDERFGSLEEYVDLSRRCEEMGIKLIMDIIVNHCGSEHPWLYDPPSSDWFNYQNEPYQQTNHRKSTLVDPYVADIDRKQMTDGWFVQAMPDLNQRNHILADYLIQNSIWWIETASLSGIRQDTYSYPDTDFMSDWTCRIQEEYPHFTIVGEEWTTNPNVVAYWQMGKQNHDGYTSCLKSLMDFPLQNALNKALTEDEGWGTGLQRIYEMLSNDFIYADPDNLVIFADNHDMSRIFTQVDEDVDLWKMALTFICTTRGIPQIYYGTEILMSNPGTTSHGIIRSDFPGGWTGDKTNGFSGQGLSGPALEAQDWLKQLLNWRSNSEVIHNGDLLHYSPDNSVYVYFRYNEEESIMVILNKSDQSVDLDLERYKQGIRDSNRAVEVLSGQSIRLDQSISLEPRSSYVFELQ